MKERDLSSELQAADRLVQDLELSRDLTQNIVHIDCDAFYAAVEQLERPELKGVPFAVGSGVLTTCNYAARKFGCRSGMAGFVAKRLCPSLIFVRPNFEKYTAKAREVREILAEYDSRYESASIDEAYLNITEYCFENNLEPAEAIEKMRREIFQKTSITVSAGIAANAKLAKVCSNLNKPDGQYVLSNDRTSIMRFMRDLPTRKVNGIGRVLERELLEIGVVTCGDIFEQRQYLRLLFGEKTFEFLMSCYLGLGRTKIQPAEEYERKSVGTESTFHEISESSQLREKLRWTARELEKDLIRASCKGKTLCLKVKLHTFEVLTRQIVTPKAIYLADDLFKFALPILIRIEQELPGLKLRLMGLRCTHLVSMKKPDAMTFFGFKKRKPDANSSDGRSLMEQKRMQAQLVEAADPAGASRSDNSDVESHGLLRYPKCPIDGSLEDEENLHHQQYSPEMADEQWECPVCLRPQMANEKDFNGHIDMCLSRQTIKEVICEPALQVGRKKQRLQEKKGKTPQVASRQTKLTFS